MLACETYYLPGRIIMELKPIFGNLHTTVYGRSEYVLIITYGLDHSGEEFSYSYLYDGTSISNIVKSYEDPWYNGYEEYLDDIHEIAEIVDSEMSDKIYEKLQSLDFLNLEFDEKVFIACNQK